MSAVEAAVSAEAATTATSGVEAQRWIVLILDVSESMKEREDLQPNRLIFCLRAVLRFIQQFFERHPLSQLQLILTANGVAFNVSTLSGSVLAHTDALKGLLRQSTFHAASPSSDNDIAKHLLKGVVSLQNALLLAMRTLQGGASIVSSSASNALVAGSKEIIVIMSSLATQDPANIFTTIEKLRKASIVVHVFHISADLYICRYLAERTRGKYCVALNGEHFVSEMLRVVDYTPVDPSKSSSAHLGVRQLPVGFCSPISVGQSQEKVLRCPKCLTPVEHGFDARTGQIDTASAAVATLRALGSATSLPTNCNICGLLLVKPSHLIRSTLQARESASLTEDQPAQVDTNCHGCGLALKLSSADPVGELFSSMTTTGRPAPTAAPEGPKHLKCQVCSAQYCACCSEMITTSLLFCPECASIPT